MLCFQDYISSYALEPHIVQTGLLSDPSVDDMNQHIEVPRPCLGGIPELERAEPRWLRRSTPQKSCHPRERLTGPYSDG